MQDVYAVKNLDLQAVARSFGFSNPPAVNLPTNFGGKHKHRERGGAARGAIGGSRSFSSKNRQQHGDKRQIVRM